MATTLALPREARGQPDRDLGSARQRMDRYAKESPTIGERQWVKLSAEFGVSTVPPDPSPRAEPVVIPDGSNPRVQAMDADLILEGGGVKGIALVGAYSALSEAGYDFHRIPGIAAGAIVGALIARGHVPRRS